jgi:group I intron endonuclease
MPYATQHTGVYRIVNHAERLCYVGSSRNLFKRRAEHFRLLRRGEHPNERLQTAFNAYGEDVFEWIEEASCTEEQDAREIELLVLKGELTFEEAPGYNIALDAFPMMGRLHSDYTKQKISETKRAQAKALTPNEAKHLAQAQTDRRLKDPAHRAKIEYVVNNDHLSYAERARVVGLQPSSVRKLYLQYAAAYGKTPPPRRLSYDRGVSDKVEFIRSNPDKTFKTLARELGCSANSVSVLARRYKLR